jgi:predicted ester cyclase
MDVADASEKNADWQGGTSVSVEENMALARRFFEARVKTDLDALDKMLAPDFVSHTAAPGQQLDRESYMRHAAESVSAFSDVRFVIEDQVAAGDKVVSRISGHGTHARSELLGTTPIGREIASIAIFIHRIEGARSPRSGARERAAPNCLDSA